MLIAGINPTQFNNTKSNTETNTSNSIDKPPVHYGWDSIALNDIRLHIKQADAQLPIDLNSLLIGKLDSEQAKLATSIQSSIKLPDLALTFGGEIKPLDIGSPGHIFAKINLENLQTIRQIANLFQAKLPHALEHSYGNIETTSQLAWWLSEQQRFVKLKDTAIHLNKIESKSLSADSQSTLSTDSSINAAQINLSFEPFAIQAKELSLTDSQINFIDDSLDPNANIHLKNINLTLDQFDTNNTNKPSQLTLSAQLNEYGKLNGTASLNLLNELISGNIELTGEQINLSDFSGFAKNSIGKHIDKGALDFNFSGNLSNNKIDSSAKLEAHQLSLSGDFGNKSDFADELGMPINTALNLLRDKDDTVRLKIPVQGDLNDPDIKINAIVNKAIFSTVKTAVISQFGPLILLTALDKAKTLNDALKLKPIEFTPDSTIISPAAQENLNQMTKLLESRPNMKITLCGYATTTEWFTHTNQEQTNASKAQLGEKALAHLNQLAQSRSNAVKDYFITQSIDGKRLIPCSPRITEEADALPKVEIDL